MKFVLIFGPSAVGKMTVGQELAKLTDLKLFHNHMSIELVLNFFDFSDPAFVRLNTIIRSEILKEIAHSDLEGVIFTLVRPQGLQDEYVDNLIHEFNIVGAEIYYVELEADLDIRVQRNSHPHRLHHKASKRNLERSHAVLMDHEENYRLNTHEGEFTRPNYLKINNTNLSPEDTATLIKYHRSL